MSKPHQQLHRSSGEACSPSHPPPSWSHPPAFRSWGTVLALRHPCPPHSNRARVLCSTSKKGHGPFPRPFRLVMAPLLLRVWGCVSAETQKPRDTQSVGHRHPTDTIELTTRSDCSADAAASLPEPHLSIPHLLLPEFLTVSSTFYFRMQVWLLLSLVHTGSKTENNTAASQTWQFVADSRNWTLASGSSVKSS